MYSCDTCFEIREMIEMNGRDSAKFQKIQDLRTWMVLKECLMNKTKKCNSVIFSNLKTKTGRRLEVGAVAGIFLF